MGQCRRAVARRGLRLRRLPDPTAPGSRASDGARGRARHPDRRRPDRRPTASGRSSRVPGLAVGGRAHSRPCRPRSARPRPSWAAWPDGRGGARRAVGRGTGGSDGRSRRRADRCRPRRRRRRPARRADGRAEPRRVAHTVARLRAVRTRCGAGSGRRRSRRHPRPSPRRARHPPGPVGGTGRRGRQRAAGVRRPAQARRGPSGPSCWGPRPRGSPRWRRTCSPRNPPSCTRPPGPDRAPVTRRGPHRSPSTASGDRLGGLTQRGP